MLLASATLNIIVEETDRIRVKTKQLVLLFFFFNLLFPFINCMSIYQPLLSFVGFENRWKEPPDYCLQHWENGSKAQFEQKQEGLSIFTIFLVIFSYFFFSSIWSYIGICLIENWGADYRSRLASRHCCQRWSESALDEGERGLWNTCS